MPTNFPTLPGAARAGLLALVCFVCFNVNGRELGTYDSQPAKFLAREILVSHTLTLDATVAQIPAYGERPGFVRTADGHFRSAYSILPALEAAVVGWPLAALHIIDLTGPLSPNLLAKLTASLLSSVAVLFAFLTARRYASDTVSAFVALGFGLGTNIWALASQTLWQHESVLAGLSMALFFLTAPTVSTRGLWIASVGLGLAGWARPQVAPAIAILALCLITRRRRWRDLLALVPLVICGGLALWLNVRWFGHPLGAAPRLESLHPLLHGVDGSLTRTPWQNAFGLLFSPSRGLVIYSPIVLVTLLSLRRAWDEGLRGGVLAWCWIAAFAQFALYAGYSVWWGGYTYGPRYLIDLLPLLVPLAAAGATILVRMPVGTVAGSAALAWSVLLAATGAWCYPADGWNSDPVNVDQHHERLWEWRDPQFVRAWQKGAHRDNFSFLLEGAFTAPPVKPSRPQPLSTTAAK
jgi:MFS family permease